MKSNLHAILLIFFFLTSTSTAQIQSKPPSSVKLNYVTQYGYDCPPATATIASDFNSITVRWDLKKFGKPFASTGPGVAATEQKRDCFITFFLEHPAAEGNNTAVVLSSKTETAASIPEGATGIIVSRLAHFHAYWPIDHPLIAKTGLFEGLISNHVNVSVKATPPAPQWNNSVFTQLPGRNGLDTPMWCGDAMFGNPRAPLKGNEVTMMESVAVSKTGDASVVAAVGTGEEYVRTIYLHWLGGCLQFWKIN